MSIKLNFYIFVIILNYIVFFSYTQNPINISLWKS